MADVGEAVQADDDALPGSPYPCNASMDDVTPIIAALQRSGFPLQTRVEHEINARARTGWRVLASEHPWRDPEGRDQFIDLIACCNTVVPVIECKKSQERALLFLRPLGGTGTTGLIKSFACWHIEQYQGAGKRFGSALYDLEMQPESYRSQFCVSTDKSGQTQRLLEQDARPVVLAADALQKAALPQLPTRSFVVPVIVTTADLFTLRYTPTEVSLTVGDFANLDPKDIEPISWVRFHKTLTAGLGNRPRTVFVVNSGALPQFLDEVSRSQGFGPPRP